MTELLLKKCDNELCWRAVKSSVAYCCDPCFLASQRHYEIHEVAPLAHTSFCDQRHAERGPIQRSCILGDFCFHQGGDTGCWECCPTRSKEAF